MFPLASLVTWRVHSPKDGLMLSSSGSFFVRKMVLSYPEYNIINLDKLDYCATTNNNKDIEHMPNYTFIKVRSV